MRTLSESKEINKIKVDKKDEKILLCLCNNSRQSLTQIAKKVGLSRDAVSYRIRNYEKKGVIQGYRTIIDITKIGYLSYHLFIKLNNPLEEIEKRIVSKLVRYSFIRSIIKYYGNFDFEIAFLAKNNEQLELYLNMILSDFSNYIQDYEILIIIKTNISKTLPQEINKNEINKKKDIRVKIDNKDLQILKILSENANMPLYKIGVKIKLSADAIVYRLKKLENEGIIVRFSPVINYASLSYNLYSVFANIDLHNKNKEIIFENFIKNEKNIIWSAKSIGKFNIIFYILAKNVEELQNIIIRLRKLFPNQIKNYETLIAYEEYKYTYLPKNLQF